MGKRLAVTVMLAAVIGSGVPARAGEEPAGGEPARPLIQIAILLDNSGSMSGLIHQAKTQLWKVVNEFATTRKNGKIPEVQVALYTYGDPPPARLTGLTNDLDLVSEKLFSVGIHGGTEYCGLVIETAVKELGWSSSNGDLKAVFIAGNEPFTQGTVNYRDACKAAVSKGIVVNTIHCGSESEGVSGKWKHGAELADGSYLNIDQNQVIVHIEAPQDAEIARLGAELNKTYVAYGRKGMEAAGRQREQDANAMTEAASGAYVQRMVAKSSAQYRNASWDLVDALKDGVVRIEDMKESDLPEAMRKMNLEERKAYVETNARKRADLQARIGELNGQRAQHVAEEMKKREGTDGNTLDTAMIEMIRKQAAGKNFKAN